MHLNLWRFLFSIAAGAALMTSSAPAEPVPVFDYRFPASYDGTTAEGPVTDQSPAGNSAKAYGRFEGDVIPLSDNVPPGAPEEAKSLDLATANGSIRTDGTGLLAREDIVAKGGFTMDLWFNGMPDSSVTGTVKLMDNWGTEFIALSGADTDVDGKPGEVVVRGSSVANTWRLDEDDGLVLDGWNHITYIFTVTDGSNPASIVGDVTLILNGVVRTFPDKAITAQTSNAGRPTSIGRHPVNDSEFYTGLIYNPAMSFGVPVISQPVVALRDGSAEGFAVTIKDGSISPVNPDSVTATLNGTAVTVSAAKEADTTTASYIPPAPLPGGVQTVALTFTSQGGETRTETLTFNVIGAGETPVLSYRFPESYTPSEETGDNAPVEDLSAAGNDGTLSSISGEPAPLSTDVPPGAAESARSLDLSAGTATIKTSATRLVNQTGILTAGGFTYDLWFKGMPDASVTSLQKILDYAGTQYIAVSGADTDNDGSSGEVAVKLSSTVFRLDADNGLNPGGWNHIRASFTVTSAANLAGLTGTVRVDLNGTVSTFATQTLTSQGDGMDRVIAIGSHPATGNERYSGLVFNPVVQFGVPATVSPQLAITAAARDSLSMILTDAEDSEIHEVNPETVTVTLDGNPLAPALLEIVKSDMETAISHTPATPFAAGRHTVQVIFSDTAGHTHYAVRSFVIAGQAFEPVFSYRFPESYDGMTPGGPVFDLSTAGNNAVATGAAANVPVPLSSDVPEGAEAGAQSLDFTAAAGGVLTGKLQLLNKPRVITAGGFTIDLRFKGGGADGLEKVLDYAGTEYIGVRGGDLDGDGNAGEVVVSLNNNAGFMVLDSDDGYDRAGWNHLVFTFKVTDASQQAPVLGDAAVTLNGVTTTVESASLSAYGDSFNRPFAIGRHPAFTENFRGLVHEVSVFYGIQAAPPAEQPSISITRNGANLEIIFTGKLQSSENLTLFTDVQGAVSPHVIPVPPSGSLFFRAVRE